jgi:hypothetical protein
MTIEEIIHKIQSILDAYIAGSIRGKQCVKYMDALIADELPDDLPDTLLNLLNEFQDDLSLYVEDQQQRSEHSAYYGPEVLLQKVKAFKDKLAIVNTVSVRPNT